MGEEKEGYKRFTISLPQELYEEFESFREKLEMSRSDSIRKAMHSYMVSDKHISSTTGSVIGCITMILAHEHFNPDRQHSHEHSTNDTHPHAQDHARDYNHPHDHKQIDDLEQQHDHEYTSQPIYANVQQTDHILKNDIQHHYREIIVSTMHVHLEFDKCMEIVAVSGPYERVKKLKTRLQKLKSVISIGFFLVDKGNEPVVKIEDEKK